MRRAKVIRNDSVFEDRIRELLESEFTPEGTGVYFDTFRSCDRVNPDTVNAPAFVFADTTLPDFGITTVGDVRHSLKPDDQSGLLSGSILNLRAVNTYGDYSTARAAETLKKAAPAEAARISRIRVDIDAKLVQWIEDNTILHEMGHLVGLTHEERRRDSRGNQPVWCRDADDREHPDPTDETYGTEFDPFSAMNYCADDIAKGFAFYHLLCEFPKAAAAIQEKKPEFVWKKAEAYCPFMKSHDYSAKLSRRDRAALRRAYLGINVPAGSRSYRTNPDEVYVIRALNALYSVLPESMELSRIR
jgi:hypothetical protein